MALAVDGFVFDLDGTIYLGDAALPGSVEGIAELRRRGKRVLFVSNKPLEPREAYAAKLTRLGIPTEPDAVITSAYVLGHHLAQTAAAARYYVIGEDALQAERLSGEPNARVHLYGKAEVRAGRKMGHVTRLLRPVR